MLQQDK